MKGSLFQKIFFTYLSILALIMAVLSVFTSSLADSYVYREKQRMMDNVAREAADAANGYAAGEISADQLSYVVDALGYVADTKIYVVRADVSMAEDIDLGGTLTGQYLSDALRKALAGETVFQRQQYSEGFGAQMLFGAYPWMDGDTIRGAMLLFSPQEAVSSIVSGIRRVIWLTAAAFVLVGAPIIWLFTRRIVRPIRAIERASSQVALGKPADDIDIRSNDEVGRLARSFNDMKRKLAQNEAMRQELIANVSHDLRTPLTSVNGFASAMADGVIKPEDYPRYIGLLRQQTQKLMALTDGILESAKLKSGRIELNISEFALADAAAEAVSINAAPAAAKNVRIRTDIPKGLAVRADRKKLEQALHNLISNAVRFSPTGGIVSVDAVREADGVRISVSDEGPGIPKADLPFIFERYYQSADGAGGGFGIGLGIVRSYIEAHGGAVDAQNLPGNGARFSIFLPDS